MKEKSKSDKGYLTDKQKLFTRHHDYRTNHHYVLYIELFFFFSYFEVVDNILSEPFLLYTIKNNYKRYQWMQWMQIRSHKIAGTFTNKKKLR